MFRDELANVRAELEPWRDQLIEHKGKLEVACTESRLLNEKVRSEILLSCLIVVRFITRSNAVSISFKVSLPFRNILLAWHPFSLLHLSK